MSSGIATVGRRAYAAGLYWENSPSGRVAQAAREAAHQLGQQADFYAVRAGSKDGRVPQFGLGQKASGHRTGMPVLAACLANQQVGSWAGAFRLREGTAVIVVRDDLIVPDGDQLYVNESDARDRLLQEIGFGGLQHIYAPEAWAIPGTDTMPLGLLLDERRDVRLRPVTIPKEAFLIGGGLAVLLIVGLAVGWYLQAEKEKEFQKHQDEIRRLQQQAQSSIPSLLQQQPPPYPPPDRKWEKAPLPMEVIESCRAGLGQVPAAIAGWRIMHLKCDGNFITLMLSREKGLSSLPKGAVINDTGTSATLSVPLPKLTPRGPENLPDSKETIRRYLAQNWPGRIQKAPDDLPPPAPPGYRGPWTPPPAPWIKRSFTVTVPELPSSLGAFFGDWPGTVISLLTFSPGGSGGSWTVEGVIYENRI